MQSYHNADDLLDILCFYRGLYARKGLGDRTSTLTVEAAVRYGEGLLRVTRRREEFAARRAASQGASADAAAP